MIIKSKNTTTNTTTNTQDLTTDNNNEFKTEIHHLINEMCSTKQNLTI